MTGVIASGKTVQPVNPDLSTARATAASVQAALEEAGCTLLALPQSGPSTRLRQSGLEWVRDAPSAYPPARSQIRPAVPSAAAIDRMDRVLAWIPRIPADKFISAPGRRRTLPHQPSDKPIPV